MSNKYARMLAKISEMDVMMGDSPNKDYSAVVPIVEAEIAQEGYQRTAQKQEPLPQPQTGTMTTPTTAEMKVLKDYKPQSEKTQQYGDYDKATHGDMLTSTPMYKPGTKEVVGYEMTFKGVPGTHTFGVGDPRVQGGRMEKYDVDGVTRFAGSEQPIGGGAGTL